MKHWDLGLHKQTSSQPAGTLLLFLNEIPCSGSPLQALRGRRCDSPAAVGYWGHFAVTSLLMYGKSSCGSEGNT